MSETERATQWQHELRRRLDDETWPRIEVVARTGSTNADLRRAADAGAPPGTLRLALVQEAGRGTRGRAWASPHGGLWMSALVRSGDLPAPLLSVGMAGAVCDAILQTTGIETQVRWPNDVLVRDSKVAGILIERWHAEEPAPDAIIGIGVNADLALGDLPQPLREEATTLRHVTGSPVGLVDLAANVGTSVDRILRALRRRAASVLGQVAGRLAYADREVRHDDGSSEASGTIDGLDPNGALRLRTREGRLRSFLTGTCRPLLGAVLLLMLIAAPGRADWLILDTGARLEGEVELDGDTYHFRRGRTELAIPAHRVEHWEKRPLPQEEYAQRSAHTPEDDPEAQYALALWCQRHDLHEKASKHFRQVFALAPDHEEARRAAGFVRHQGEWLPRVEAKRRQGLALYEGDWIPIPEAERRRRESVEKREAETTYRRTWKALVRARTCEDWDALIDQGAELARQGEAAFPALRRGATHATPQVRAVAYEALNRLEHPACIKVLSRRIPVELIDRLRLDLCRALSTHPEREQAVKTLVGLLVDEESRLQRIRLTHALHIIDPAEAVGKLIPYAGESPVATSFPSEEDGQGDIAERVDAILEATYGEMDVPEKVRESAIASAKARAAADDPRGRIPYPAAEALTALTGQEFGPHPEQWAQWWKSNRTDFTFPAPCPPALPDRSGPDLSSFFDGSLRQEMLDSHRKTR
jgi:BirA family biotin operon repressor/biotin-[acetyl-CoA-carboxylase] ligase